MGIYKIFDQEMTKEKFIKDKKLKKNIIKRKKEIYQELANKIIEIDGCDFHGNHGSIFLTKTGYVYQENKERNSYYYDVQLIGFIAPPQVDEFVEYLLNDENILKRKRSYKEIFDFNTSISFNYKNKEYSIPDDIICSNNKVSKYNDGWISNRIENKLYNLANPTEDLSDYEKRKELRKELGQIEKFLATYDEEEEYDIPPFLRSKINKID